jgi:hypothetical protein
MWDFFGKVVDSLPSWFLMALIVFLAGAALYLLPRVRRDKRGKLYLFSRSYEYQKKRAKEQSAALQNLDAKFQGIEKRLSSIECEDLKQTFYISNEMFPKEEQLIAGLKYVYNGRNGKVREDVAKFVKDNPDVYSSVMAKYPQWALPERDS